MNSSLKNNSSQLRFTVILMIILFASLFRFIPFLFSSSFFNFSPINTIALFGGMYFINRWQAFLIPIISISISDLFINFIYTGHWQIFYQGFYWQYLAYVLIVLTGVAMNAKGKFNVSILAALLGSVLFFIISNLGVWLTSGMYTLDWDGFTKCYILAIPFFKNTLIGDLTFTIIFTAVIQYFQKKYPTLNLA